MEVPNTDGFKWMIWGYPSCLKLMMMAIQLAYNHDINIEANIVDDLQSLFWE